MAAFHPNDPGITTRAGGASLVVAPAAVGTVDVAGAHLHRLPRFDDPRGSIVVGEAPAHLPFAPTRLFVVRDVPAGEMRGDHAHRRCHQFILALSGSVDVVVDDGNGRGRVRLDEAELGLHVPPMVWSIQRDFSPDAQVLVLASVAYDRAEYIDDHDEFVALVRGRDAVGEP